MKPMGRLQETGLVMVDELLTVNNEWNEPLIHDLFFAPDADSILSNPLKKYGGMTGWLGQRRSPGSILCDRPIEH
jgi:hypothetical protein